MKRRALSPGAGMLLGLLLTGGNVFAVGTRTFELRRGVDFEGGELAGVAVDSMGAVRAGLDLGKVEIEGAQTIWSALGQKDGSVLLGTGSEGKLLRVTGARVEVAAETGALAITSLVEAWNGAIVLGTLPNGKVFRYDRGKLETLATLPGVEHVWQVAYDAKTRSVFAATGPEGKLFRIDANGTAQVHFDAEEQHLMSVAVGPDGVVYAGASDKAKLYRITGPGRATVLHDFERTEVRAIAVAGDGTVYAVANEITPGSYTPRSRSGESAAGPASKPTPAKGKGVLVAIGAVGGPDELFSSADEHFVALAIGEDSRPYVGTGVEGRVYTVDQHHNRVLVADTAERQIFALGLSGKERFVAASDPAVFRPLRGIGGVDSVWTSKVLDAGLRATFGRMRWEATGNLELSTRSGNSKDPDDTWSAWTAPMTRPDLVKSPAGRYLQVRARWNRDASAELRELVVPFVTDNLRAVLTEITAGSSSATTLTGVQGSGGPIEQKASSTVSLNWKVDNPDKDELRYRLQYQLLGTSDWFDMLDPREKLTKTTYSWETADLPEGRYLVRVVASDEPSNPPDRAKRHELVSDVFLVDNTPPVLEGLQVNGRRLTATAIDGLGPIARVEVGLAGSGEWQPFFPVDGVFDEAREELNVDLAAMAPPGAGLVSIRIYDAANNAVVRTVGIR